MLLMVVMFPDFGPAAAVTVVRANWPESLDNRGA
jgi:hypothetical protein